MSTFCFQLFEGMKAYRSTRTGKVHMFRPNKNANRLNSTAERIALPVRPVLAFCSISFNCVSAVISAGR